MKSVLIIGGTGLLGKQIADFYIKKGVTVSILSRKEFSDPVLQTFAWNPSTGILNADILRNKDIIINLSGAGIADKLWTKKRKRLILESRIRSTRLLIDTLIANNISPQLFINASAIGYYGNRPGEKLPENSERGKGFISDVCVAWENEVRRLENYEVKYAILRIGIVLSKHGGSLPKLLYPIKMKLNVLLGKAQHYISWIHIQDFIKLIDSLVTSALKPGTYNCVAPHPSTQEHFNKTLIKITDRRTFRLRLPVKLLSFFPGELSTLFLSDLNVVPGKLMSQNFKFAFPELESALTDLLINSK